jgi:hypothetical protein
MRILHSSSNAGAHHVALAICAVLLAGSTSAMPTRYSPSLYQAPRMSNSRDRLESPFREPHLVREPSTDVASVITPPGSLFKDLTDNERVLARSHSHRSRSHSRSHSHHHPSSTEEEDEILESLYRASQPMPTEDFDTDTGDSTAAFEPTVYAAPKSMHSSQADDAEDNTEAHSEASFSFNLKSEQEAAAEDEEYGPWPRSRPTTVGEQADQSDFLDQDGNENDDIDQYLPRDSQISSFETQLSYKGTDFDAIDDTDMADVEDDVARYRSFEPQVGSFEPQSSYKGTDFDGQFDGADVDTDAENERQVNDGDDNDQIDSFEPNMSYKGTDYDFDVEDAANGDAQVPKFEIPSAEEVENDDFDPEKLGFIFDNTDEKSFVSAFIFAY